MKIIKNRKALSPVVASIILIAVTVAVSIAVAAWMGALTMNFTQTEQMTFTGYAWGTPGTTTVPTFTFTVKNTGSSDLSISEIRVDGSAVLYSNGTFPVAIAKGTSAQFVLTNAFTRGTSYEFSVVTSKGNVFGPYVKTAP